MATEQFSEKLGLNKANKLRLNIINGVLREYAKEGYILTLRQLYYQLVSKNIIDNNAKEYAKLSILLTKGRMAGIVDWDSIEDRGRVAKLPWWSSGVKGALSTIHSQYRLNRQEGQKTYMEVCIEKDALSNIFERVTSEYHIRLTANKGYSSSTAMYAIYERIVSAFSKGAKRAIIIYSGDHDPSGVDMIRDIEERVSEMLYNGDNSHYMDECMFSVNRIALTMQQIEQYNPPENFAKITDPRAKNYIEQFGDKSWELDALPPKVLADLTRAAILKYLDVEKYNKVLEKEKQQKSEIYEFMNKYDDLD
jgi:hypothetical protein